ncbi:MAG: AAA family ATPase [Chloroflexi bacterium]|nr:AAA family ATPase [Chloroflexota bacterium]
MLTREDVQWQRAAATSVRAAGGQTIAVRAALARPSDVGRASVRLHPDDVSQLRAVGGDTVALERAAGGVPVLEPRRSSAARSGIGQPDNTVTLSVKRRLLPGDASLDPQHDKRRAFARVVVDGTLPPGEAAIDGPLRRSAGVGLGEVVQLRLVPAAQALAVRVERRAAAPAVKSSEWAEALNGVVTGPGGFVQAGRGQLLRVTGTTPDGPVVIDSQTLVQTEDGAFTDTGVWYEDVGGLDAELARVREIVELPLLRPELFSRLGVVPPKGVLLHGAPGTGKTLLARAVANECRATFVHINGPDLMHKYYGESEHRLKQLFEDATASAPSIIFIDEIDAIAPKRAEVLGEVEKRVVAQFLALMDGFVARGEVVVIGATNLPQAIDPALRRPGRFDREIEVGQPDRSARLSILRIHTRAMPLDAAVDLDSLADRTPGFVGADIEALCQEAGMAAIRRLTSGPRLTTHDSRLEIGSADFLEAFHAVEPTAARQIVREHSIETFADVGGYERLKRQLKLAVGRTRGILLEGPSGVGKTLLARAVAGELKLPLIAVDGPLLYSKWLGESEKALADVFTKARHNAPCVLLLDQLEAIGDSRLENMHRMVGQLVRELDDISAFTEVAVVAATNRPDIVDPAVKRRFDLVFQVELPDEHERTEIIRKHAALVPEERLVEATEGMTGADLAAAVRRARLFAIERNASETDSATIEDLQEALCRTTTR